ncbi:hypothetical protein [Nocardia sp. XZ_19_369]|nr:hypothetical protein [Nocardia sp. XZ_19_369]
MINVTGVRLVAAPLLDGVSAAIGLAGMPLRDGVGATVGVG